MYFYNYFKKIFIGVELVKKSIFMLQKCMQNDTKILQYLWTIEDIYYIIDSRVLGIDYWTYLELEEKTAWNYKIITIQLTSNNIEIF